MTTVDRDPLVAEIIGAAIEIHHDLGPGLLESVYQHCLMHALIGKGIEVMSGVPVAVHYKGAVIDCGYRLDLLVGGDVIVEIKSVDKLQPIHTAQVLTYLRLSGARRALLMNFNGLTLKEGLRSYLGARSGEPRSA
ncbi:MAG TPA: GxxExxY protein [Vicinamibacterales bacterium]|nr:GxxExxY protein [Vicinamibacterales bacterium]